MRNYFKIEKGLHIVGENQDTGALVIQGAGVPAGISGDTASAPIGSLYLDTTNGYPYHKKTSTNSASDWIKLDIAASIDQITWRSEKVVALTDATVIAANNIDPTTWFDNDDGFTPVVGQYVIGNAALSPELFEITGVGTAPADGGSFVGPITGGTSFIRNNLTEQYGQSYRPTVSGPLNSVSFTINSNTGNAGATAVSELYLADFSGFPTGSVLATSATVPVDATSQPNDSTLTFTFSSPYNVVAGTQYAIVVRPVVAPANTISVKVNNTDAYTDGDYLWYNGLTWQVGSAGYDVIFSTTTSIPSTIDLVAADPIADNDTWVIQNYLPDDSGYENQAIFHVPVAGSAGIKIADIDWSFLDSINLASPYVGTTNGTPVAGDSGQVAIGKLDANQRDLTTLSGVAQGSTVLGAFSAVADVLFAATYTIKSAFQRIGDLLAQLRGVEVTGITAITTVDSVPHATTKCVTWMITAFEEATPANRQGMIVSAITDGASTDNTVYAKTKLGANFNLEISTDVSGADFRLRATSATAGVTVTARRIEVVKNVL